uniref:Beta-1,4-galactosyltransferase n=3 Tax=Eptatretus burgeri TaxID=7764 RepID=A0A8C4WXU1_EPTBU
MALISCLILRATIWCLESKTNISKWGMTARTWPCCRLRLASVAAVLLLLCLTTSLLGGLWLNAGCWGTRSDQIKLETKDLAGDDPSWGPHKMAVIVPFRDRFDELLQFLPHLHLFLSRQRIRHHIYIMNQADGLRFNRASLINAGVLLSANDTDYIAMHDVDLLPLNDDLNYSYPALGPYHVSAPNLHPLYHYPTFVGGILLLTKKQFHLCNGLSNRYWGWGREDDEFYRRIQEAGLKVFRPDGITTGYETFHHIHDPSRHRDQKRIGEQRRVQFIRDRETGVSTVRFRLLTTTKLHVHSAPCTVFSVQLYCNRSQTPWCEIPRK